MYSKCKFPLYVVDINNSCELKSILHYSAKITDTIARVYIMDCCY